MNPAKDQDVSGKTFRQRCVGVAARSAFAIGVFLVILEVALHVIGLERRRYLAQVRNNQTGVTIARFDPDQYKIWAPVPGEAPFNQQGFIGSELPRDRTPGTLRIACLGDSCTQCGSPPYPERLARLLEERGHSGVEVMNWGVAGYSSFQGLARLRHDVLDNRADIYTIYFGWNDHWIHEGFLDDVAAGSVRVGPIWSAIEQSRVAQAIDLVAEGFRRSGRQMQFRVPLPAYRKNLRQIIELACSAGGKVMLITAPGCLGNDRPIQEHLKHLDTLGYSSAAALHADYVQATCEVAAELQVELLDAARYFEQEIPGCDYFLPDRDPVHLTDAGLEVMAEQLAERLIHKGWLNGSPTPTE